MNNRSGMPSIPSEDVGDFEELLTGLAASFVNLEPEVLDTQIENALKSIVLFLGIERSTVGCFDEMPRQLMTTHSWAVQGIEPIPATLTESSFPFLSRQVRAGKAFALQQLGDLPPEAAADVIALRRFGIRSMAVVPLAAQGRVLGWLSFGALRAERDWPERLVRRLRLIGEIFANAFCHRDKQDELRQSVAENIKLRKRLEAENALWREEVLHSTEFDEVVGESPQLHSVMLKVEQVAETDSTVLLLGETGTGKDLIATAVHRRSRRAKEPLVRVNCAALPATLIESELFGHDKGAFSGAIASRPGRFELADGGTVVLDEVGELPLESQAKLLRVLQSGEFERLGSSKTRQVDARVIAATNRDLVAMVDARTFRADLFYRLSVFPVRIPSLRERKGDIPLLVAYFIEKLRAKLGRPVMRIPDAAVARLSAYSWPGNVRELENVIERSMIVSPGPELLVEGIPGSGPESRLMIVGTSGLDGDTFRTLEEVERDHICAVCDCCGWKINGKGNAAERLGLNPNTLRSRMKKLGIERPVGARRAGRNYSAS